MTPAILLAAAALTLITGVTLMARRVPDFGPADAPALYRRRITGAMLVGASLFLGGFTLAATFPTF